MVKHVGLVVQMLVRIPAVLLILQGVKNLAFNIGDCVKL